MLVVVLIFALCFCVTFIFCQMREDERIEMWQKNGNTWPPKWQNQSESFRKVMAERENEILTEITGENERWENYMTFTQPLLVPSFTKVGFKVVKAPTYLHDKLLAAVNAAVSNWDDIKYEFDLSNAYYGDEKGSKFIYIGDLNKEVSQSDKHY